MKSTTTWSTKAPRTKKPTGAEAEVLDRIEQNRRIWAARHRDVALDERRLRKERAEREARWSHKNNGTIETHERASRRHQGALAKLYENGSLDVEQLAAAVEIATIVERIGSDVAIKTASLETRVDGHRPPDAEFIEKLGQVRREVAYTRWRATVRGPIAAILEMIVGETVGFTIVARRYRMHNRTAKQMLIDALDHWSAVLLGVSKEIDGASLQAAHAALL